LAYTPKNIKKSKVFGMKSENFFLFLQKREKDEANYPNKISGNAEKFSRPSSHKSDNWHQAVGEKHAAATI
jgi:hypothetical protein